MKYIIIGGAILLLLAVIKGLLGSVAFFLPLGGSTIAEMGIVFGFAVAISAIKNIYEKNND
ncbi:MAG: hypothetical protein JKY08_07450 [Flavobacteriaceae bacterium]|nr:hypothetical protein [Flavobacteriaceae bacterium]